MFNDHYSKTNGEEKFFMDIKDKINVIFDVGCRSDSEFLNFTGEVHYFDPVNKASYFNNFGLGNNDKERGFYKFSYLTSNGPVLITDFTDHYQYSLYK